MVKTGRKTAISRAKKEEEKRAQNQPTPVLKAQPRPGSIGEHVAQGGKLPGQEGFDATTIEKKLTSSQAGGSISSTTIPSPPATQPQGFNSKQFGKDITPTLSTTGQLDLTRVKELMQTKDLKQFIIDEAKAGLFQLGIGAAVAGGIGTLATFGTGAAVAGTTTAVNTATATSATTIVTGALSGKTLLAAGGALAGAASAMFLGQWSQAEAPEPISIVMRDILRQAQATGDYTLYDEAAEARDEILDLDVWEKITMWSPFSPAIGIPNKIKGAKAAAILMDKLAQDQQIQRETGESNDQKWERIRNEQSQQEQTNIDYYNQQRQIMINFEREAAKNARDADARFWAKEREKQRKLEAEDREAIAEFWQKYRIEAAKAAEDNRPSKLNFGII